MLVVTSVYNDSYQNVFDFCLRNKFKLIVYHKNDSLRIGDEIVTHDDDNLKIIDIPNYGRCDYSFLHYIIKNYDNLPEQVLFTKANFKDQNIQLSFSLFNRNFMFIGNHIKYGLLNRDFHSELLSRGIHRNDIEDLNCNKDNIDIPCFKSYLTNDFYKIVYKNKPFPDNYLVQFGHGPCFCVTKELIRAHPINIYETLLDTFYPDKGHWDNWPGHSQEEIMFEIGHRYHNNLQRFWMLLFVQDYKNENVITDYENFVTMKNT